MNELAEPQIESKEYNPLKLFPPEQQAFLNQKVSDAKLIDPYISEEEEKISIEKTYGTIASRLSSVPEEQETDPIFKSLKCVKYIVEYNEKLNPTNVQDKLSYMISAVNHYIRNLYRYKNTESHLLHFDRVFSEINPPPSVHIKLITKPFFQSLYDTQASEDDKNEILSVMKSHEDNLERIFPSKIGFRKEDFEEEMGITLENKNNLDQINTAEKYINFLRKYRESETTQLEALQDLFSQENEVFKYKPDLKRRLPEGIIIDLIQKLIAERNTHNKSFEIACSLVNYKDLPEESKEFIKKEGLVKMPYDLEVLSKLPSTVQFCNDIGTVSFTSSGVCETEPYDDIYRKINLFMFSPQEPTPTFKEGSWAKVKHTVGNEFMASAAFIIGKSEEGGIVVPSYYTGNSYLLPQNWQENKLKRVIARYPFRESETKISMSIAAKRLKNTEFRKYTGVPRSTSDNIADYVL